MGRVDKCSFELSCNSSNSLSTMAHTSPVKDAPVEETKAEEVPVEEPAAEGEDAEKRPAEASEDEPETKKAKTEENGVKEAEDESKDTEETIKPAETEPVKTVESSEDIKKAEAV